MYKVSVELPRLIVNRPYWMDCVKWAVDNNTLIKFTPNKVWLLTEEDAIMFRLTFNV